VDFVWHDVDSPGEAWDLWALSYLRDGDILFVRGQGRMLMGLVDFASLSTELMDSPFSHAAIVARENGSVIVYDTGLEGPCRFTFGEFLEARHVHTMGIKRVRPQLTRHIPEALDWIRHVHAKDVEFDKDLKLGNEQLYCTELLEVAFRRTGLALSDPVRIDQLPNFGKGSQPTVQLLLAATDIDADQEVYLTGNDRFGLWSSPHLELVLAPTVMRDD
jgi:hypothetical protein